MSQEIEKIDDLHSDQKSKTLVLAMASLPNECNIPGYWETLAENTNDWAPQISASPFWRAANSHIENWKKEYRRETQGLLYKGSEFPSFVGKSAARICTI